MSEGQKISRWDQTTHNAQTVFRQILFFSLIGFVFAGGALYFSLGKIQKVLVFDYIFKCSVPETILGRTNYLKPPEIVKKGYEKKYKKKRFPAKTLCLHLSNLFDGKFPIKFFSKPRQLSIFSCVFFLVFGFLCWFFIFRRARRERILGGMGFSIKNPYNHGLKVAALKIGESSDLEHGIFLGKTRSGKSQLIKELIENILILKNQRVFVIDPKGELFKTFQNYPKNLINIDPYGKGIKIYWDPWIELRDDDPEHIKRAFFASISETIIPESSQRFWTDAPRLFLTDILFFMPEKKRSIKSLFKTLLAPPKELYSNLLDIKAVQAAALINPESGKGEQAQGIISTVISALQMFSAMPQQPKDGYSFSIREFAFDENSAQGLFINPGSQSVATWGRKLLTIWMDILVKFLLEAELDETGRKKKEDEVFIVIDEIATLDKITSLHKLLTLGAGYKSSCWFGVQSISDIEEIYGRNLKESLVTNVRTKVVLKQGDPKTAAWCADLLLKREVKEKQLSHSVGGVDSRDSYSASEQRKELYNVSPSDLLSLDNLEGYIHSGKLLKKIKLPIFQKKEYLAPKESSNLGA